MQQARKLLVVRSPGRALAEAIVRRLPQEHSQCRYADDMHQALAVLARQEPVDLLVAPADQVLGSVAKRLKELTRRDPLLRIILVYSRLYTDRVRQAGLDGVCVAVPEATAPEWIASLVERLRDGPLPGFALPPAAAEDDRRAAEIQAGQRLQGRGERIAVFGHDTALLNLLTETLSTFGYDARASRHVDRVHQRLVPDGFAGAVFDVDRADDPAATRILAACRAAAPGVPVVVLAGFADRSHMQAFRDCGAAGCVSKPYELSDLLWQVRHALEPEEAESQPLVTDMELAALLGPTEKRPFVADATVRDEDQQ